LEHSRALRIKQKGDNLAVTTVCQSNIIVTLSMFPSILGTILYGQYTLKRQCKFFNLLFFSADAAQEKEKKRRKCCCALLFQSL
jgi:hypothetical protein